MTILLFLLPFFTGVVVGWASLIFMASLNHRKKDGVRCVNEKLVQKRESEISKDSRWIQRQILHGHIKKYKVLDLEENEIGECYGIEQARQIFRDRYKYWDGDVDMFIIEQKTPEQINILNEKKKNVNSVNLDEMAFELGRDLQKLQKKCFEPKPLKVGTKWQ